MSIMFTKSHKIWLTISILFLLSGGSLGYLQNQAAKQAEEIRREADAADQRVMQLQQRTSKPLKTFDLESLQRAIPEQWEMPRFFADLTMAAEETGVTITSVEPSEYQETGAGNQAGKPSGIPAGNQTTKPNGNSQILQNGKQTQAQGKAIQGLTGQPQTESPGGPKEDKTPPTEVLPPTELKDLHSLTLTISVLGRENALLAFLDRLQHLPRLVWVNDYEWDLNDLKSPLKIDVTIYSHAPWDGKGKESTDWPFPIQGTRR
jgi:Tfp pilus assembly protein PilO